MLTSPLDIVDACHDEPMTSFMQLVAYLFQGNNSQKVVMPEIFGGGKRHFQEVRIGNPTYFSQQKLLL